ncbi:MAG: hypothetical protein JWN03_4629 [Nocardia sp.]|uniref:ABC transporter substrate-binding protein n=1 Tax=Nocardia sp. TaxID=1821 RepID=UPI00262ACBD5|nr:ABC transporter substrate-binding protein [Nocardia sp.]MCU1644354.1 hypothetical protein [Nocardia sp.]
MQRFEIARAAALFTAVVLVAASAACAGDIKNSSDSRNAVLGDTIKIGGLVTKTSPTGYNTASAEIGVKARIQRANDEGGVNGRKIEFIGAEDDGFNPATADAAVKKLVQHDKVFAIVPWIAPAAGSAEVAERAGVARFGWASNETWCTSTVSFGWSGCLAPKDDVPESTWWNRAFFAHQVASELGGSNGESKGNTAWIQGFDSSESAHGVETFQKGFAASGFNVVGASSSVPATAPPQDWLPYINKIMKSNNDGPPDVVVSIMSGKTNLGLYAALKKAGFKGMIADASSYDPRLLADPQGAQVLEGVYSVPQFAPFESDIPEVQKMMADVRKIDPGHQFTQNTAMGYWSADIFLAALAKAGKDVTPASFITTANSLAYENPGLGKLTFPMNKTEPSGCAALVKVQGGKFVVARPLECFSK